MKNYKKIICFVGYMLIQQLGAMEQDYTTVSLEDDKQIVQVTTYEGLRILAGTSSEDAKVKFAVQPSALAEFLSGGQSIDTVHGRTMYELEWSYKHYHPEGFNLMVSQAIDEIRRQNNQESMMLQDMQQQFRQKRIDDVVQLQKKIEALEPDYTEKKNEYFCRTAFKTGLGLVIIGGWVAVGLFSWVINHCHHPWD
jgi:hypothetical protein